MTKPSSRPSMDKARNRLGVSPDHWTPGATSAVGNIHHVLFRESDWVNQGWPKVLRDSFVFRLPLSVHDSLHKGIKPPRKAISAKIGYHVVRELDELKEHSLNSCPQSRLEGLAVAFHNVADTWCSKGSRDTAALKAYGEMVIAQTTYVVEGIRSLGGNI